MSAILEARGVHRHFRAGGREVRAVDGVDLDLGRGELVVLAGPSGSGKTTLLHLLAGLERADAGTVLLDGLRVDRLGGAALARMRLERVGLVFQAENLLPTLTAAENAELTLQVRRVAPAERSRRVGGLFERLGIAGLGGRFPGELSGGEQQRVALARALAGDPAVVIADEPTAHLDAAASAALLDLLAALARERRVGALVASHDPLVIGRADRCLGMRDGRIEG
jgi:putative ABC transport system ATP-binding protein